jgi:hypothetical protein
MFPVSINLKSIIILFLGDILFFKLKIYSCIFIIFLL